MGGRFTLALSTHGSGGGVCPTPFKAMHLLGLVWPGSHPTTTSQPVTSPQGVKREELF